MTDANRVCPVCHHEYSELNMVMNGDCVCNLAVKGNIFQSKPHMSSHFELLA